MSSLRYPITPVCTLQVAACLDAQFPRHCGSCATCQANRISLTLMVYQTVGQTSNKPKNNKQTTHTHTLTHTHTHHSATQDRTTESQTQTQTTKASDSRRRRWWAWRGRRRRWRRGTRPPAATGPAPCWPAASASPRSGSASGSPADTQTAGTASSVLTAPVS